MHAAPSLPWAIALAAMGVSCRATSMPANGGPTAAPTSSASSLPHTPPRSAEECKACNGIWGRGIAQVEFCNCGTHDAGKRCRDGDECEGMCVAAHDPEREVVQAGPPALGFFVGRCSEVVTQFGCIRIIERGVAKTGPYPLDKPPQEVCVD